MACRNLPPGCGTTATGSAVYGLGLFATGLLNVLFAFGESLTLLLVVWTLNGFFRAGAGRPAPAC
jgi:sugar phosphate permease